MTTMSAVATPELQGVGIVTHKTQWFSGLLSGEQAQS
jgi:hypothetical protein